MLQHYLVSMNANQSAGMIDISGLTHNTFTSKQLEDHIFNDYGGSSEIMLKFILEPNSAISNLIPQIETTLKEYGPLLVSRFEVYEDFYNDSIHSYSGRPQGNYIGLHAMVLIGIRHENNSTSYLLQNWWKQKQFVEVDHVYLKACSPVLFYVKTPQYVIPSQFTVDYARFAENENMDKPESFPHLEGPILGLYPPYPHK